MSALEDLLAFQIKAAKLPLPFAEYRFMPPRLYRFDFAWPNRLLAVECEGGTWGKSRHTTGKGFAADCVKYNLAAIAGWRVLRVTGDQIKSGEALQWIERVLL